MRARTDKEINSYLVTIKATARRDMHTIHLKAADYERIKRSPLRFDCVKQPGGGVVTVFNGALIPVVGIK